MQALLLLPLLCAASVLATANPDCNACFMKNAGKDLAHTHGTQEGASSSSTTESTLAGSPEELARPKRTVRTAAAGWDHDGEVQGRPRDVLAVAAEGANVNTASGHWWDDAPVDVAEPSPRWPYRGRWREARPGTGPLVGPAAGPPASGGAWGDVTDGMPHKVSPTFV